MRLQGRVWRAQCFDKDRYRFVGCGWAEGSSGGKEHSEIGVAPHNAGQNWRCGFGVSSEGVDGGERTDPISVKCQPVQHVGWNRAITTTKRAQRRAADGVELRSNTFDELFHRCSDNGIDRRGADGWRLLLVGGDGHQRRRRSGVGAAAQRL